MDDPPAGLRILRIAARSRDSLQQEAVGSILDYIRSQRGTDGGFCDRSGRPDLYYSFFGLAGLAALGAFEELRHTRPYLDAERAWETLDPVHLICLVRSRALLRARPLLGLALRPTAGAWLARGERLLARRFRTTGGQAARRFAACLQRFRSPDGALAAAPHPPPGEASLYLTFLALLAGEEIGAALPESDAVSEVLAACNCPDGGFGSRSGMTSGVVSATSAALVLQHRHAPPVGERSVRWLRERQDASGGFLATAAAPFPDLLSTATALLALCWIDQPLASARIDLAEGFVAEHWNEDGGFCGSLPDPSSDLEYTFYGLLALGCLRTMREGTDQ